MTNDLKRKYNISVWPNLKLNYWAIPKVANTAIKVALSGYDVNPNKIHSKVKWVHNPNNVTYVDRETALQNNYRNFTVIRHPYDRFVSLYKDFGLRRPLIKTKDISTVDNFIRFINLHHYNDDDSNIHIRSMHYYLTDGNNMLVDDVIQLNDAAAYLKQHNLDLKIFNKTSELDITLTDKQKENIYNRYKKDFETFGFTT